MVVNKQVVTKCRTNQVFIVPQISQKITHPFLSIQVKNKQSRYRQSQYDEISRY